MVKTTPDHKSVVSDEVRHQVMMNLVLDPLLTQNLKYPQLMNMTLVLVLVPLKIRSMWKSEPK